MAKTIVKNDILKFRGIPITGDAKSFVKLIEKKFGFSNADFEESSVFLSGGQFVGEDAYLIIHYSQKSKTVYAVEIDLIDISYKNEYNHYKSLYTQKYGKPIISIDNHGNENAVFEIEGGRIMIYDDFKILYTNTINEKLAIKEHDIALLDEI